MRKGMEGDSNRKKRLRSSLASSFPCKKQAKTKSAWKHRFVCLARYDQVKIPTTDVEKDELLQAGLGEKCVEFASLEIDGNQFRDILYTSFPKLKDGGGFQLCRCIPNTRQLEALSAIVHSLPMVLKERVGTARTYILPLQRDLDLDIVVGLPEGPMEECLVCGVKFSICNLRTHVQECQVLTKSPSPPLCISIPSSPDSDELPPVFNYDMNVGQSIQNPSWTSFGSTTDEWDMEQEFVDAALQQSMHDSSCSKDVVKNTAPSVPNSLAIEILSLKKEVVTDLPLCINIRRTHLLLDALREARKKKFDPRKHLKVTFVGEGAIDQGGPRREFFRLLSLQASEQYFQGESRNKYFNNNVTALQEREYFHIGQYAMMSIAQGGNGFPFLSEPVYEYISTGIMPTKIEIENENIPDATIKFCVDRICSSSDDDELQITLGIDEVIDVITQTGYRKALPTHTVADKNCLVSAITNYHLMFKVKTCMDQFMEGLQTMGLLQKIQHSPLCWKPMFVNSRSCLTAESLKSMFDVAFSEKGTNIRLAEEQTFIFFADFLDECEDGNGDCTLQQTLIFFTGSDSIPPCGFEKTPSLCFRHSTLATSSTCDLQLRLPLIHTAYSAFKDALILSIKGNDGFGCV